MNIGIRVAGNGTSTCQIDHTVDDPTVVFLTRRWAHGVRGYLKSRSLLASNASGAAPCRSARHTCDAAGRPRPPDPCIRRIQRDRNDSLLREMHRYRDRAKHRAANDRHSNDCQLFHEIPLLRYLLASHFENDMPSLAAPARVAMINGSHERHDMENLTGADHPKHRQFENISASKSLRPHTCGRLGGSGAWWFWPRTHR